MAATYPCPDCHNPLAMDDLNMKEGVGLCRVCGKLSRLSDLVDVPQVDPKILAKSPAGCFCEEQIGGGFVLHASLRSVGNAIGLLAISLFWNGIVSIFILEAAAGLYTHYVGPVPSWFPIPQQHGRGTAPFGQTIFLCLFLTPFVLIGISMIAALFVSLFGRVEVAVDGSEGKVRTGIGPLSWNSRFDASSVKRVALGVSTYQKNGQQKQPIRIEADRTIDFASGLPSERRTWMLGVLQLLLIDRRKTRKK